MKTSSRDPQALFRYCISFLTGGAFQIFGKLFSAFAHPSGLSCRVPHHEGIIGHILRHDGAGAHKCGSTDSVTAHNSTVGSQCGAFLDQRGFQFAHAADMSAGVKDIRKDHARSAEDVVLKGNAFVYGNIVLDFAGVSYDHILTDDNVLADIAIAADGSPRREHGRNAIPWYLLR